MYESVAKLPCGEVTVAKLPCDEVTGNRLLHLILNSAPPDKKAWPPLNQLLCRRLRYITSQISLHWAGCFTALLR